LSNIDENYDESGYKKDNKYSLLSLQHERRKKWIGGRNTLMKCI